MPGRVGAGRGILFHNRGRRHIVHVGTWYRLGLVHVAGRWLEHAVLRQNAAHWARLLAGLVGIGSAGRDEREVNLGRSGTRTRDIQRLPNVSPSTLPAITDYAANDQDQHRKRADDDANSET